MTIQEDWWHAKLQVGRKLKRRIGRTNAEVLDFLIERTLGAGRASWTVSYKDMTDGVLIESKWMHFGLDLSISTIKRAIKYLKEHEYIHTTKRQVRPGIFATVYTVDMDTIDDEVRREERKMTKRRTGVSLKSSSKTRGSQRASVGSTVSHRRGHGEPSTKYKTDVVVKPTVVRSAPLRERLETQCEEVKEKSRTKLVTRLGKGQFRIEEVTAAWEQALASYDLQPISSLTTRSFGALKRNYRKYPENLMRVFRWAIENWETLSRSNFSWVDNFPRSPCIMFIAMWWQRLIPIYRERYAIDRQHRLAKVQEVTADRRSAEKERGRRERVTRKLQDAEKTISDQDEEIRRLREEAGDTGEDLARHWGDDD